MFRFVPVVISSLLIAAHFQRAGMSFVTIICLLIPFSLFYTHPLSMRLVQFYLVLASLEWIRTLYYLVQLRMDHGMEWTRLAVIIGSVALFTLCSAFVFRNKDIKRIYSSYT